jgi:hypothetical protein
VALLVGEQQQRLLVGEQDRPVRGLADEERLVTGFDDLEAAHLPDRPDLVLVGVDQEAPRRRVLRGLPPTMARTSGWLESDRRGRRPPPSDPASDRAWAVVKIRRELAGVRILLHLVVERREDPLLDRRPP